MRPIGEPRSLWPATLVNPYHELVPESFCHTGPAQQWPMEAPSSRLKSDQNISLFVSVCCALFCQVAAPVQPPFAPSTSPTGDAPNGLEWDPMLRVASPELQQKCSTNCATQSLAAHSPQCAVRPQWPVCSLQAEGDKIDLLLAWALQKDALPLQRPTWGPLLH